ncbi:MULTISPECIES: hypothetical protein [unclassified Vibrio]|uniref:hypothetical protein n=1 Tax=unclassified Vibrio TaxID=2614977 RepID=UPI0013611CE9|nr:MULTISPECIES: hypothetical protein [unclassified Vibrio]NAW59297.1 hypothetical protein [Vibrio sp. V36_P2S2PM302]NAX21301.1 hypothetical protein [Vibrio sp. V39_P1S14PM300]NAX24979.1 hypothetical protein [Vibrio sp. V38_P2S17PM301]NAX31065.1 hypothetical protein [Vibrio sp. V37_P2S8PM304]
MTNKTFQGLMEHESHQHPITPITGRFILSSLDGDFKFDEEFKIVKNAEGPPMLDNPATVYFESDLGEGKAKYWTDNIEQAHVFSDFESALSMRDKTNKKYSPVTILAIGGVHDSLQAPYSHLSTPAQPEMVPISEENKSSDYTVEIVIDTVGMTLLRAELDIQQPFDVQRSLCSIDRRIGDCVRTRNFTRAARLQEMYQALQTVQRKQKVLEHDV